MFIRDVTADPKLSASLCGKKADCSDGQLVLGSMSPVCLQLTLCHLSPPVTFWLSSLVESPTASTDCWRARRNLLCHNTLLVLYERHEMELATVLSLGPGSQAVFLMGLNTLNVFDPKATDRNYELWYFQPSNIGKQNLRKIQIYSPARVCSAPGWPCSFKAGGTGVW